MTGGELQGWYRDPFGLHEKRYFSAGRPTRLVRDGPIDSYDEPPSYTYEMPADVTGERDFTPGHYIAMTPALPGDDPRLPAPDEWSPWSWYGRASIAVVLVATLAILAVMLFGGGTGQPP